MLDDDVIRGLARTAANYRRGLFCPAVLWREVTALLAGQDAARLLAALPTELQEVLRGAYRDRPWSLQYGSAEDESRLAVERWCQGSDAQLSGRDG